MQSHLRERHRVTGDPVQLAAVFASDPGGWLPAPARARGIETWTITLRAGPLRRLVACRVEGLWRHAGVSSRAIGWDPIPDEGDPAPLERGLPVLQGELILEVGPGGAELLLDAKYEPPAGAAGLLMDRLLLHHAAQGTARRFLETIGQHLEAAVSTCASSKTSDG